MLRRPAKADHLSLHRAEGGTEAVQELPLK